MDTAMVPGASLVNGRHLQLWQIPPDAVIDHWATIESLLQQGKRAAGVLGSNDFIMHQLLEGRWQFFTLVENGVRPIAGMITEIQERPDGRTLIMRWLGGTEIKSVVKFWPRFEKWAKAAGCVRVETWTRKALTRLLPEAGFHVAYYVMQKEIGDG